MTQCLRSADLILLRRFSVSAAGRGKGIKDFFESSGGSQQLRNLPRVHVARAPAAGAILSRQDRGADGRHSAVGRITKEQQTLRVIDRVVAIVRAGEKQVTPRVPTYPNFGDPF